MSMWDSSFGKSAIIAWLYAQIVLLWASVTGGDPPDLSAKVNTPSGSFTTGNFATYNSSTAAIEDTEYNVTSFVAPDGDKVLSDNNFTDAYKAQLDALPETSACYETHDKTNTNKSAAFTKAVTAGSILLYVIVQHVSGTPVFSFGTTLAGDDLIPQVELAAGAKPLVQPLNEPFEAAATLYATITDGTVNVIFILYENILVV